MWRAPDEFLPSGVLLCAPIFEVAGILLHSSPVGCRPRDLKLNLPPHALEHNAIATGSPWWVTSKVVGAIEIIEIQL